MSALSLLSIPLKKSGEVDLVKPFRNAIASSFCGAGPSEIEKYNEAIAELNRMRNNACAKPLDKHESALETVYRYHDQLGALERKVPPGEFQVAFKWKDAFDKGSFFAGSKSLTISSLTFEKACVLFNMAALQSQVASAQNMEHDDGLKLAAKLFQLSSGVLAHLKGIVLSCVSQEPTPDLFPETLHALSALMMAQAQEVFVNKAIQDKMKDVSVAKLAAQCGELYTEAARLMSSEKVKYIWDREWLPIVNSKQEGYKALAEFYQASVCEASKKIGERITRLQQAADLMKSSSSKGGAYFPSFLSDFSGRIQHSLEAARKENDFIYHDRVPDIKTCEPVAKVALAKSLPYQDRYSQQSRDLFEDLVPLEVSTFLAIAESKKTEMINVEVAKMRDASQLLNGLLASMNLPAALEDSGDSKELPPSLKDKQKKIKAEGGAKALNDALRALPDLLQRNREILDETERALNEERQSDTELRTRFKEKWKRTESDKLTGAFKENANRYRQIIDNAVSADAIVKDKFEKHRGAIELLSNKSEAEVLAALPSGKGGNKDSPAAKKLMMLMHAVDDLKKEREELEKAFKTADPDLKNALCSALAREGRVDPEIARRALETTYGPILEKTAGNLGKQERIVAEVQEANGEFTRGHGNETGTREAMMKQLAAAYDAFMELKGNLKEGTDFYNDLTQILVNFQNKVTDFCFARKTEKDELMKDLTSAMASVKLDSAPSQPRHFGPDAGAKKEPPPRPPPPAASTPNVPTSNAPPYSVPPYNPQAYNPVQPGMVGDYSQQHQQYQHQQQPQMQQPTHAMPYPTQPQGMPLPYSYPQQPYPSYTPPMPAGYNPYGYMPPGQQQPQQQQQQHQQQQGYPYQYPNQAPGYPPYQQQQQHQPQGNPGSCQQQ